MGVGFYSIPGSNCWIDGNKAVLEIKLYEFHKDNGAPLKVELLSESMKEPACGIAKSSFFNRGTIGFEDISFGWVEFNSKEVASFSVGQSVFRISFYSGTQNYYRIATLCGINQTKPSTLKV